MSTIIVPDAGLGRREFIVGGLSLAALLSACADDDAGDAAEAPRTRTIVDSRG
ncbi:MAG: hypothetical protein IT196_27845, partial [Acidimicrobiales bacterium]|nr:hypothetical protein [Acidimicrobiales bacterium]